VVESRTSRGDLQDPRVLDGPSRSSDLPDLRVLGSPSRSSDMLCDRVPVGRTTRGDMPGDVQLEVNSQLDGSG
jgi:hypothetical protein